MAPWFRYLSAHSRLELMVWYVTVPDPSLQGVGFDQAFTWDTELFSGYRWEELENCAKRPSLDRFFGTRVRSIASKLSSQSPSVVLLTGWHQFSLIQVLLACKLVGIPCLIRAESNSLKSRAFYKRILHRIFLKTFVRFLYIGESNKKFYLECGVPAEQLHFAPYFVDNNWFEGQNDRSGAARRQWRTQFQIGPAEFVILFVGKLQPKKNVQELVHALGKMKSSGSRYCLVIAGEGGLRNDLQGLAEKLGVRIVFTGFVNQSGLPAVYASADCLVLPSSYGETWGLVVNEAMNFSLPVVVSDRVGCGPDLVIEGETGFRYQYGNSNQLAEVLAELEHDMEKRRRIGRKASQHVQKYSMKAATRGLVEAVKSLQRNRIEPNDDDNTAARL